ncbi:Aste57867_25294 [Aphanomyces stellatus]|uniref:Kinesin-like protein n=1 Tax=Aphanomyces stellatus TaxID=120398 RepID=A0A485LU35_9STRA|nr:hypothetical protein As57867_025216 [Aphanomyces stellatus]VFU01919.1 Aste57867_25294 [Aphanomyces stellatus]
MHTSCGMDTLNGGGLAIPRSVESSVAVRPHTAVDFVRSRRPSPPPSATTTSLSLDDDRSVANERIKVFVRVRPPSAYELSLPPADMVSTTPTSLRMPSSSSSSSQIECSFDRIFSPDATQADLYASVQPLVADVIDGYNATIFAYGQTGTGKTHTILGMDEAERATRGSTPDVTLFAPSWGIIPRALCQLVETTAKSAQCSISCAYVQIYNEKIFDLLTDKKRQRPLGLREALDGTSDMVVQGLSTVPIASLSDVITFLKRGRLHRVVRETDMNAQSSRSHAILQVTLKSQSKDGLRRAKLNLVDLAGSEKWNKHAMKPGVEIEEMKNINTSLSALGNCIAALTQPGRKHIPYRDSSLTRLLQDSLGGNTRTVLIATITARASDETNRTIQFADRTRAVMQCVVLNQNVPMSPRQLHLGATASCSETLMGHVGLAAARAHIAKLKQKVHELVEQKEKQADVSERIQKYQAEMREKEQAIESLVAQNETYEKKLRDGQAQIQKLQQQIHAMSSTSTPPKQLETRAVPEVRSHPTNAYQTTSTKPHYQLHVSNNQLDPINAPSYTPPQKEARSWVVTSSSSSPPSEKLQPQRSNSSLYKSLYGANKQLQASAPTLQPIPSGTTTYPVPQQATVTPMMQTDTGGACHDHKLKGCVLCALRQKMGGSTFGPTTSYPPRPSPRNLTIIPALPKAAPYSTAQANDGSFCSVHHLNRCVLCSKKPHESKAGPIIGAKPSLPSTTDGTIICKPHGLTNCVLCARMQPPARASSFPSFATTSNTVNVKPVDR